MKPLNDTLAVVTATTNRDRSRPCRWSWEDRATYRWPVYTVLNGGGVDSPSPYLGTAPAFAEGVRRALAGGHQIIACLHDDLLIECEGWDEAVLNHFMATPGCGLAGFLGGTGLGHDDIYKVPYNPHQLARSGVVSNERNAEAHGERTCRIQQVAVLDGFSQIGRREFWQGAFNRPGPVIHKLRLVGGNLFSEMHQWGVVHHAYDAALGAFAARLGWEVWMLPVACWHAGGQTAVGDPGYQEWAKSIVPRGDQDFWELAHREVFDRFHDVLPIRVK